MIARCKLGQWLGFTLDEQAWMVSESEYGIPVFIALGHVSYPLWWIEHRDPLTGCRVYERSTDQLITIKVDDWPPKEPEA